MNNPVVPALGAGVAACDIRDRDQVNASFAAAAAARGPIHALVANSGLGGPNTDGPDDRFDELVATNLNGTYYCVRAVLRQLAPGPERRDIVVIASILARIAVGGYTGYSASKAGLLGFTRHAAYELAPDRIRVNAVCPGSTLTEFHLARARASATPIETLKTQRSTTSILGRWAEPEEIAWPVLWLASDEASYITGTTLMVDGGLHAL